MEPNQSLSLSDFAFTTKGSEGSPQKKASATSGAPPESSSSPPASVTDFVRSVAPAARRVAERLGVPVEAVVGQWGLETGWGKSVIKGTNNLGNIKDFSGSGVAATDNMNGSRDKYRQYESVDHFAADFARLLSTGRYKGAVGAKDAQSYFAGLKAGGYAEDPAYVQSGTRAAAMAAKALGRAAEPSDLPDIAKAPKWADITKKPEFLSLDDATKRQAKEAYFDHWIAPHAGGDRDTLRQQFLDMKDGPGLLDQAKDVLTKAGTNMLDVLKPAKPLMEGAATPAEQRSTVPVRPEMRAAFNAQWDAATPEQRQQIAAMDDWRGQLARERDASFAKTPDVPTAAALDPRAEARRARLVKDGLDPTAAAGIAPRAARAGILPGQEVSGTVQESTYDFDTKNLFDPNQGANGLNNPLARGVAKGGLGLGKAVSGYTEFVGDVLGIDGMAESGKRVGGTLRGKEQAIGERGDFMSRNVEGAINSITQQLPLLLAGVSAGQTVPLAGMAFQSFGQEYSDGKAQGQDAGQAATRAGIFAAFEVIGEKFGLGETLQALKGAAKGMPTDQIAAFLWAALKKEVPGELLTTTGQFGTDKFAPGGVGLTPDATGADYLKQVGDTIAQTILQSGMMAGGTTGASAAVRFFQERDAAGSAEGARASAMDARQNGLAGRPAPEAAVTPDGRVEPTIGGGVPVVEPEAPQAHPTVQTADQIVRELAEEAGIPVDTVLPSESVSDAEIAAFAKARQQRLQMQRDGVADTVATPEGLIEQETPAAGLTPVQESELATLQGANNPAALRSLYGGNIEDQQNEIQDQAVGPAPGQDAVVSQPAPGQAVAGEVQPATPAADAGGAVGEPVQQVQPGQAVDPQAEADVIRYLDLLGETDQDLRKQVIEAAITKPDAMEAIRRDIERRIEQDAIRQQDKPVMADPVPDVPFEPAKPKTEKEARVRRAGKETRVTETPQTQQAEAQGQQAAAGGQVGRGTVGMKLAAGQVVMTSSGRKTTPFPKFDMSTERKAGNGLKKVNDWLIHNAYAEAVSRGDEFNARQFGAVNLAMQNISQADKDSAEEYLFGEQPRVVPSILRPLSPRTEKEAATAKAKAEFQKVMEEAERSAKEEVAKQDAKPKTEKEAKAAKKGKVVTAPQKESLDAELEDALGHLGDVLGDVFGAKMNITGKQHSAGDLLPALSKVIELLVRRGFTKFADATAQAAKAMRGNEKTAPFVDQISPRQWKAAYNAIAEYHDGADSEEAVSTMTNDDVKAIVGGYTESKVTQEKQNGNDGSNIAGDGEAQGAENQEQRRGAEPDAARQDSEGVGAQPAGDAGKVEAAGDSGRPGRGAAVGDVGRDGAVSEVRDAADRRPGDGGARVADVGAGSGRGNYHVANPEQLIGGTPKVRFARNKAAIEALQSITSEGRQPTPEELDAMAAYIGWGSFGQELFKGTFDRPAPKDGWKAESDWLREHLGKDGWESAQRSIINAHYTDPITVSTMWDMVRQMGFTGGRVLEPSMGVGNFFGLMPRDLMAKSRLAGIEMEETTGGMAQILYPEANIQIKPYQDSKTADGFYDLVIGNWPFAKDGPADRRYMRLSPSLHDYFFLKALDQTRPGGLVVGITSAGTMDKKGTLTRAALADKADLVAAFRLPSGAFEKYAGTSVVTDIIILKKRAEPNADVSASGWLRTAEVDTPSGQKVTVNEYFAKHPENVLGTLNFGSGSTYGRPSMIVDRPADLEARMAKLAGGLPAGLFAPASTKAKTVQYVTNNTTDREQSVVEQGGKLFQVQGEYLAPLHEVVSYKLKDEKRTAVREKQIAQLVKIRQAYGELIDAERDGLESTESRRAALKKAYDAFLEEHGTVTDSDGLNIIKRAGDPFYTTLASLETPTGAPSAIMTRPTIRAKRRLEKPTVRDALVLARNESVDLDMDRIAELAGVSAEAAAKDLVAAGAVFKTPVGGFEVADVYLSGNVRRKLREAEAAAEQGEDMAHNIEALKAVVPKDIPYFNIEAKFGATWVRPEQYREFIAHLLGIEKTSDIDVKWAINRWKVRFTDRGLNNRPEATTSWGHAGVKFDKLVTAAMGNVAVKVQYRDQDGNLQTDEKATAEANEKASKIREEFSSWLWADPVRKIEMERTFNDVMNAIALPKFDGSFLTFEGMALERGTSPFSMRKHQVDAVWRGLANGRSLNAHEVGTGKTYTMGALAVESRRYGMAKKPIIFAHNANSASVAREIGEQYPGAKLLYVDNLTPERIGVTLRQIANDDWDAIVVPHSLIDRFTLKRETLMEISREQIEALEQEAIDAAQEDGAGLSVEDMDDEDKMKKVRSATAKQLVHARNAILKKIDEMAIKSSKEGAISFEDMGIDMVIVDEAHEFKKPPLATRMRMKGLNTGTSNQSISLMFLTDYVKRLNAGRGVHLFTGTPITNTMTEIYNMMRYVMDDQMARDGIRDWDAWFNTFADSTSDVELTAAGEYEPVTRLAAFVNVAELRRMIGQYMDIVFADDMPEFKPRATADGRTLTDKGLTEEERDELMNGRTENPVGRPYKKVVADVAEMSKDQQRILAQLQKYATRFKNASKKERREIMLRGGPESPVLVETGASNAGLDARLYDMNAADEPNSKVNRAVRRIMEHYNEHPLATQVVFVERGFSDASVSRKKDRETGQVTVTKKARFNLVADLVDKLVAQGVPREQIAIVDGGTNKEKRKAVADAMNRAEVRVVIGNTKTLGVGVNMQTNLRAMHHLDAPWMPGDLEQRNGRGHRQGNKWNTVMEYRYLTERIDGRRWQVLAVKDRFIKAFLKAKDDVRVIEGDAVSMDEEGDIGSTLADAAGDPRLMLMNKLRADVLKLENKERMHAQGIFDATHKIKSLKADNERNEKTLARYRRDDAAFRAVAGGDFSVEIGGKTFTDIEAANAELAKVAAKVLTEASRDTHELGKAWGFTISAYWPSRLFDVQYTVSSEDMDYAMGKGSIESARQTLYGIKTKADNLAARIGEAEHSIPRLEEATKAPFARAADLDKRRTMLADLEADIQKNPIPAPAWLRSGAPVNTEAQVGGKAVVVEGHRWTDDGYFVTVSDKAGVRDVPYLEVTDENGLLVYEERPFAPPTVAKSATVLNELARTPSHHHTGTPEAVRANALTKLKGLESKRESGKLTEAEYRLGVQELIAQIEKRNDAREDRRADAGRRRGADWIKAALRRSVADEKLEREIANFADWLLDQNPNLAADLGISISEKDGNGVTGQYNPMARVVKLFSMAAAPTTAVHEILHHTERMMPGDVQAGLLDAWRKAWDAEYKASGAEIQKAMRDMLAASLGDKAANERVMKAFSSGVLQNAKHYPLYSPSEFWAVKATDILAGRFAARGNWPARAAQWLREFAQKVRAAFGMRSDAPLIRALDDLLAGGTGEVLSTRMLSERVGGKGGDIQFNDIARRVRNNALQFFGNRHGLKNFNAYDRTLSTQFNKALKDSHYGKVFGLVNAMQNEVSLTSIRPAELAPGVLPKVDDIKAALVTMVKGKTGNKDLETAAHAVFAGTLAGRNVMDGKVWTREEFAARFGESEAAWSLYQQARAAIDQSLDEVAAAEAYSMAYGYVLKGMRRAVIDDPQGAEALIVGELEQHLKVIRMAVRAAKKAGDAERLAEMEGTLAQYKDTKLAVEKIFLQAKNLKAHGYAPLMRFGKFSVTVQAIDSDTGSVLKDVDGNPITEFYSQYETEAEAIEAKALQEKRFAGQSVRVTAGPKSQKAHELYAGISPETLALFAEAAGISDNEATKKLYQLAMSDRSALKRRLERNNIEGYTRDLPRVLSNFITSNGRFAAQRYYMRDINNAIKAIPKQTKGDVLDEAIKLKGFILNPADPAAPVSSLMFAWFLGGSVASAAVNLTQPIMMTAPYLSQFGNPAPAMAKALPYAMGKKEITDKDLRDALKRASQEGIVEAQEIFHLYSQGAQGVAAGLVSTLSRLPAVGKHLKAGSESARARVNAFLTLWGSMFAVAESFNRKLTFVAAWDMAKSNGHKNPYAFAVRAVNETQGIYNKVNRPNWARGPVGRTVLTFKQFSLMYLELLNRMWRRGGPEGKRAALVMLAVLMLAAGEEGLPFAQDLDDLIDTLGQAWGLDTNMRRNKRRWAHEILGKELGDVALYGISSRLPLDFAGRLGLGNLLPGSAMFKPSSEDGRMREVTEVMGPAAGLVQQVVDAYDAATDGSPGKALQNLMPTAVKNLTAGVEMSKKGYATDYRGRKVVDVTLGEAVTKGIGFNPTVVAQEHRKTMPVQQDIALQKKVESSIVDQMARAVVDKDKEAIKEAQKRITDWNKNNPQTPIRITPNQVRGKVRQMMTPKGSRVLKQAPKEMRGRVGLDML